ncbi:MAG: hypothetical protein WCG06_05305 [Candidatus Omnitrophota bacterium]
MFELNKPYTRDEIHDLLGGSKQSYLPTANGKVTCACLTRDMDLLAPEVIYVGTGPVVKESARILCEKQKGSIPVFIKKDTNNWAYWGNYSVERFTKDAKEIEKHKVFANRLLTMLIYMKKRVDQSI